MHAYMNTHMNQDVGPITSIAHILTGCAHLYMYSIAWVHNKNSTIKTVIACMPVWFGVGRYISTLDMSTLQTEEYPCEYICGYL